MNRIGIAIIVFVAWSAAIFFAGMEWRDRSCDVEIAEGAVVSVEAERDQVIDARKDDSATQANTAVVEQGRVDAEQANDDAFRIIYRDVVKYVQANPDPAGCDLGDDGLRAWRAANAGRGYYSEPVDSERADSPRK